MTRIDLPGVDIKKLSLGCGESKGDGIIGIDINDFGQAIVWDLTHGIPLPDNSVEYFRASHFFEHLPTEAIYNLFREIYRVGKNEALLEAWTPYALTEEAYYPGHLTYWHENMVKGIVTGFNGVRSANKKEIFRIEEDKRIERFDYPELYFKIRIIK